MTPRFVKDLSKTVSQVMTKKRRLGDSKKKGASREEILELMHQHRVEKSVSGYDSFKT